MKLIEKLVCITSNKIGVAQEMFWWKFEFDSHEATIQAANRIRYRLNIGYCNKSRNKNTITISTYSTHKGKEKELFNIVLSTLLNNDYIDRDLKF